MRETVRKGYEEGDYQGYYGKDRNLNGFERDFFVDLERRIPAGGSILDLGCGTGVPYDRYFASRGFRVTGVDFSPKHLAIAVKNVPQASFIQGDIAHTNFDQGSFDAVLLLYSLFHIPRKEHAEVLMNVGKMLKPGGMLMATLGTAESEYSEEQNWAGASSMAWSSWSPEHYRHLLRLSYFNMILERYEGKPGDVEFHLWILAEKKNIK